MFFNLARPVWLARISGQTAWKTEEWLFFYWPDQRPGQLKTWYHCQATVIWWRRKGIGLDKQLFNTSRRWWCYGNAYYHGYTSLFRIVIFPNCNSSKNVPQTRRSSDHRKFQKRYLNTYHNLETCINLNVTERLGLCGSRQIPWGPQQLNFDTRGCGV